MKEDVKMYLAGNVKEESLNILNIKVVLFNKNVNIFMIRIFWVGQLMELF